MSTTEIIGTLKVRSPKDPLSPMEKSVFGENARIHPISGYPLEQGMTDHGNGGNGQPSSDNNQAVRHFMLMVDELRKIVERHKVEGDPTKKQRHKMDHQVTADHVTEVAQKLIDAKVLNKTALSMIPQL